MFQNVLLSCAMIVEYEWQLVVTIFNTFPMFLVYADLIVVKRGGGLVLGLIVVKRAGGLVLGLIVVKRGGGL